MKFYSEPVIGESFFAREDILALLLKSAKDIRQGYRHNIAITGRGLIGKSSLLLHFLNVIKDYNDLIPLYLNLRDINFPEFCSNFINAVLYHSLKGRIELSKAGDYNYLKARTRQYFPKTYDLVKKIEALINEANYDEAYSELWDLNLIVSSEAGKAIAVVVDEFNLLSQFSLKRPYQVLGQKIMVQPKTLFILSSSATLTAKKILAEKLSLLFGGFQAIDIGPFTPEQSREFVRWQCKKFQIHDELIDFLVFFTGGHPFYLSSIIERINSTKFYGAEKILPRHLGQIIAELFFHQSGAINRFFEDIMEELSLNTQQSSTINILRTLLSTGRITEIVRRAQIVSTDLKPVLDKLLEFGLISQSGSIYALTDAAFRTWVGIKSKPKNLLFDFMPQEQSLDYAKEIEAKIAEFRSERKRLPQDRIVALISSFNNDRFFIDERMRVLPHLKFIEEKRFGAGGHIIMMQSKKRWIFVIFDKIITEQDIYGTLKMLKEFRCSDSKIILLAIKDIDNSAKLLAKQKHLWVWGHGDMMRLFEFYKGYAISIA